MPWVQTHHRASLFSGHSSKTLPSSGRNSEHGDQGSHHGDKAKTVHHLAWAFDLDSRQYVLVYELTQWWGPELTMARC